MYTSDPRSSFSNVKSDGSSDCRRLRLSCMIWRWAMGLPTSGSINEGSVSSAGWLVSFACARFKPSTMEDVIVRRTMFEVSAPASVVYAM